ARADYPERPITMVVPFGAGGAIDIIARILSEPLAKALGQPVVIENRTGASGNIGVRAVARAQPDGYTILMASSSFAVNPSLFASVPYDPFKDFVPIADLVYYPVVIATRPDLGMNSVADLAAAAKANPGKLNFASPGSGTIPHLAVALLMLRAGIAITHIPYPGGSQVVPQIKAGKIRPLVQSGRERWPDLADVPTLVESGYKDAVAETWQGFLAPAGTPPAIVDRLARETVAILRRPEIAERFKQVGLAVVGKG